MNRKSLFVAVLMIAAFASSAFAQDEPGLLIRGVAEDSPAERADLIRGDVLLEIDGTEVNTVFEVREVLSEYKAGQRTVLTILRGGNERRVTVTLEDRLYRPALGIEFAPETHRFEFGRFTPRGNFGVIVIEVVDDSPADKAGIETRDAIITVDGENVSGADFKEIISNHKPGDRIALEVSRPGKDGAKPIEMTVTLGSNDDGEALLGIRFSSTMMELHPDVRKRFEDLERGLRDRMDDGGRGSRGMQFFPGNPDQDIDRAEL